MLNAADIALRKRYWERVRECLVRFHDLSSSKAKGLVAGYTKKFPLKSQDPAVELIYHYEPFRLACEISGRSLRVRDFSKQYRELLLDTSSTGDTLEVRGKLVGVSIEKSLERQFQISQTENEAKPKRELPKGKKPLIPAAKARGGVVRETTSETSERKVGTYGVSVAKSSSKSLKRPSQSQKTKPIGPKQQAKRKRRTGAS